MKLRTIYFKHVSNFKLALKITRFMKAFKILSILIFLLVATSHSVVEGQQIVTLSKEKVEDKVRGAWAGK